jgi:hypothetical protein
MLLKTWSIESSDDVGILGIFYLGGELTLPKSSSWLWGLRLLLQRVLLYPPLL